MTSCPILDPIRWWRDLQMAGLDRSRLRPPRRWFRSADNGACQQQPRRILHLDLLMSDFLIDTFAVGDLAVAGAGLATQGRIDFAVAEAERGRPIAGVILTARRP
jgi:hypothetical protein